MKFCDKRIQKHLLNGGKIKKSDCGIWKYRPILIDDDGVLVFADTEEYYTLSKQDLTANNWEIVEPEYNWDKIIKDRILCQFWDDDEFSLIGTLIKIGSPEPLFRRYKYQSDNGRYWINCRPVRKDEVIFYKDKK